MWAIGALADGLGLRAVARVLEVDPNTALAWLGEAADHAAAFSQDFPREVRVTQVQLDELFALLSAVQAGQVSAAAEAIRRFERLHCWVWGAIDPESQLLSAIAGGKRTLATAQHLVHQVVQVMAPGCLPLLLTDGFKAYATAVLTHCGHWVRSPRRQAIGPAPKPRWIPRPALLYEQVVKSYRRRWVVHVRHRVGFGNWAGVNRVLAATDWQINTAFIERVNLTIRQHVAAVGRRVITSCQGEQLTRRHAYYNCCLPHTSLRLPLPQPEPTHGNGSAKMWQLRTPAMAAGLTDHVWTLSEVLLCRVPPWPPAAGVSVAGSESGREAEQARYARRPGTRAQQEPMIPIGETMTVWLTPRWRLRTDPPPLSARYRNTTQRFTNQ
jgi:IS1 family transposase